MNTKARIKQYLRSKFITVSAFEQSIGVSNGYINSMRKGFGLDKLEKIGALYPDLDLNWLQDGEGSMLKSGVAVEGDGVAVASGTNKGNQIIGNNASNISQNITPSTQQANQQETINKLLEQMDKQTEIHRQQVSKAQEQVSKAQEQVSKAQEQMDRLLSLLEKQQEKDK